MAGKKISDLTALLGSGVATGDLLEISDVDAGASKKITITEFFKSISSTARTNLGLAIGSDVQAHGDVLDDLNTLGVNSADSEFLVGTGAGALAWESGATARTSMGLGTGDNAQFTNITATGAFTSLGINDDATENAITISSDEEVTMPLQPSFRVTLGTTTANVTGNNTAYDVAFDTETWDIGGNYASSLFTAPVTGKYRFETHIYVSGAGSAPTYGDIKIITSNRTYTHRMWDVGNSGGPGGMTFSVLADMDAADTAKVQITIGGIGTDTLDVEIGELSFFSGNLVQ